MIKSKEILINVTGSNIEYYKHKGYDIDSLKRIDNRGRTRIPKGTKILVNVEDLPKGSNVYINIQCDYCGKIFPRIYNSYNQKLDNSIVKKDCCKDCKGIKNKEIFNIKYGVDNPMQLEEFKIKSINTSLNRYGVEHAAQLEENKQYLREYKRKSFEVVKKDF